MENIASQSLRTVNIAGVIKSHFYNYPKITIASLSLAIAIFIIKIPNIISSIKGKLEELEIKRIFLHKKRYSYKDHIKLSKERFEQLQAYGKKFGVNLGIDARETSLGNFIFCSRNGFKNYAKIVSIMESKEGSYFYDKTPEDLKYCDSKDTVFPFAVKEMKNLSVGQHVLTGRSIETILLTREEVDLIYDKHIAEVFKGVEARGERLSSKESLEEFENIVEKEKQEYIKAHTTEQGPTYTEKDLEQFKCYRVVGSSGKNINIIITEEGYQKYKKYIC